MTDSTQPIGREAGRHLFGPGASTYESARPEYPERIYEVLASRCGLGPGRRLLEVGPGTGQATERLARAGAHVLAVEPDRALASLLGARLREAGLEVAVRLSSFEDEELPAESFDLAVSATAFHWIDQDIGLAKLHRLLVPGGWWAMWWHVFLDPSRPDPFGEATTPVFDRLGRSPSMGEPGRAPFALDTEARIRDLTRAGFENVEVEAIRWTMRLDTGQVRALYSTFSPIASLEVDDRERVLDEVASIAERSFGGRVERPCQTVLYTSLRP